MKPLPPHLDAPAWLHGATAFTTVRTHRGAARLWPQHLARLRATCAFLDLPGPDPALPPLEPWSWGLLRVTVAGGGTFWSHRPLQPGPRPAGGVNVRLTGVRVHPQLAAHKTGNYLPSRLAARQSGDAFEGWLRGEDDTLADGTRTSPLLELDGTLVLPAGGLPGVTRAAFVQGLGVADRATERPVLLAELSRVTRAWVCGSGVGVVPVRRIMGEDWTRDLKVSWPETEAPALVWPDDPTRTQANP
ncbi:aminotransferase class IV [Deinococcus aerophilus]|uniref:Aminotransferase class IV n=1 Tax=Deinococcus aerophilus TaxID=522488 RepID=A0ABQ2GWK8_9DEIO|nr:aminotransferase class IV [Deinococcus aerophilus]GGM14332.1 hypothetical protein GCM10010841_23650 [Deinococcus aerophilus]